MAGRVGQHGLDKVVSVVVMCWDNIPEEGDLDLGFTYREAHKAGVPISDHIQHDFESSACGRV